MRDVFIVNMNNRAAQKELCRYTKFPEELYRIALSYERRDKYAKLYVSTTTGGVTSSAPTGVGLQTKTKLVGIIPGGIGKITHAIEDSTPGADFPEAIQPAGDATTVINQGSHQTMWPSAQ